LNSQQLVSRSFNLEAALDYQFVWQNRSNFATSTQPGFNRKLDLEKSWRHGDDNSSLLQLDRLNLQWREGNIDAIIGRQAIGFGRIILFSPLDIISPFAPYAIDTDIRPGVDAVKAVYHYRLDGQIGLISVWGEEKNYNSILATWTDNYAGIDILSIGGELRGREMFGLGLAGNLGEIGIKAEISFYQGKKSDQLQDLYDSFSVAGFEAWYRFENGISLIAQYLYNGPGADDPANYPQVINSAAFQEGLTYLLGQHYLLAAPSYEVHPLVTIQGLLIYNFDDRSSLIRPSFEISLSDNTSVESFLNWYTGESPETISALNKTIPRSEFGLYGNGGGIFLTWYF
jgi:hypothetical protein